MSNWHREHRGLPPLPRHEWSSPHEELGVRALQLQQRAFPDLVEAAKNRVTRDHLGLIRVEVGGIRIDLDARMLTKEELTQIAMVRITLIDGPQRVDVATNKRQPIAVVHNTEGQRIEDKDTIGFYADRLLSAQGIILARRRRQRQAYLDSRGQNDTISPDDMASK